MHVGVFMYMDDLWSYKKQCAFVGVCG